MGLNSTFNFLFRGCEAYMIGKIKEARSTSEWKQGNSVVGMQVNTEKAMEYLSKHPEDMFGQAQNPDGIPFIIREGMAHYQCELINTELLDDISSALLIYR